MIWIACEKQCVEKNQYVCRLATRVHEFVEVCGDTVKLECGNCSHIATLPIEEYQAECKRMDIKAQLSGASRAGLTKYPRIEPHTGELVNSRDDEARVMKAFGMHAAPHGINERFNDEACEKLKSARQKREQRRREIERKRKALGRMRPAASASRK